MERKLISINIDRISRNKHQPRKKFEDESIKELAQSIINDGLLQPIIVRPFNDNYEIVQGERRYRACKLAKLTKIPVFVQELDDKDAFHLSVIENIQREQLTPIEEAMAFKKYVEMGFTHEEISKKVSKSRTYITSRLRLLKLLPEIQDMIAKGKISEGHAKQLLRLQNTFLSNNKPFKWGQSLFLHEYSSAEKVSVKNTRDFVDEIEYSIIASAINLFFKSDKLEEAVNWSNVCIKVNISISEIDSEHIEKACQYEVGYINSRSGLKKSNLYQQVANVYKKYESIKERLSLLTGIEKRQIWDKNMLKVTTYVIKSELKVIEKAKKDLTTTYRKGSSLDDIDKDKSRELDKCARDLYNKDVEGFTEYIVTDFSH